MFCPSKIYDIIIICIMDNGRVWFGGGACGHLKSATLSPSLFPYQFKIMTLTCTCMTVHVCMSKLEKNCFLFCRLSRRKRRVTQLTRRGNSPLHWNTTIKPLSSIPPMSPSSLIKQVNGWILSCSCF